jgi:H+/Cl- antiporter ClcA
MAKYGSEKIKGHGIPEAMEAVLTSRSRIEAKVAILKPLSAAIAIGTGGPFGAEGPIIQTGGAFGSLVGQFISTTAAERKVLLACGAGAGMAATFNTPIAGVILAIELLLFEFRSRSFIPLVIACTLATSVRSVLLGQKSMFSMGNVNFDALRGLPFYVVLGGAVGNRSDRFYEIALLGGRPIRPPADWQFVASGDWSAGSWNYRIFRAARAGRGLRYDLGHPQ